MKILIGVLIVGSFFCLVLSRPANRPEPRNALDEQQAAPAATAAVPAAERVVPGDPGKLIKIVGRKYNVPAGALYGIWMKESNGLTSGWGDGLGWLSAEDQASAGSECFSHYGSARCGRWWRALEVICAQRRPDGTAVCDQRRVRTSYALAMGPMQILPTHLVKEAADGSVAWTRNVADLDGDGVVDPHSLPDALAITAKLVRGFYEEEGDWGRAINRYYGSQTEGYFEGTDASVGVIDHWRRWCSMPGHCRDGVGALASN